MKKGWKIFWCVIGLLAVAGLALTGYLLTRPDGEEEIWTYYPRMHTQIKEIREETLPDGTKWRYFVGPWEGYDSGIECHVCLDPETDYGNDQDLRVGDYIQVIYDECRVDENGVYLIEPGHVYILNREPRYDPNSPTLDLDTYRQ